MRLFVAVQPPPAAVAELELAVAPLRTTWPGLRWTGAERWHVTLAFLGDVPEERLGELMRRLERAAARHPGTQVRVGRGGAFPSARKARVLCALIEGSPEAMSGLTRLAASVAAASRRAGAPPPDEGRRLRPHITLARSREPADLTAPVGTLGGFAGQQWSAGEIRLVRSYTGPLPRYETLGSWPLRSPRSARG